MVCYAAPPALKRRAVARSILPLVLAAAFLTGAAASEKTAVRVRHVIDGDTIVLEDGRHVRLLGVNAPEYKPWDNLIEPYSREAKDYLTRLLAGRSVRLETDLEKSDRYGRFLAYVYLEDDRLANRLLVDEGLARARYYPPNGAHRKELESAQRAAAAARRGLWSANAAGNGHARSLRGRTRDNITA